MTIRLRPHHLLCLLTYVGKGYSRAFVENYDRIAKRINDGEDIVVVEGPDDICAPISDDHDAHCHRASVLARDRTAAEDVGNLLEIAVTPGVTISIGPAMFRQMRSGYAERVTNAACTGCQWFDLCLTVAKGGYGMVRVRASDLPEINSQSSS